MAGDQAPRRRELSVVRADDDGRCWSLSQIKQRKPCRWAAGRWLAGPKGTEAPPSNDTVMRLAPTTYQQLGRCRSWARRRKSGEEGRLIRRQVVDTLIVEDCQRLLGNRFSRPFHRSVE